MNYTDVDRSALRLLKFACCVSAFSFLLFSMASLLIPYDLDQYEGNLFLPSMLLVSGQPIFGPDVVLREPFVFATYGPVYYALHGLLLKVTGPVFWPGRLISLLATIGTAYLIRKTVLETAEAPIGAFVAVATFLLMPPAFVFGALQRVDALGVLLSVLSLTVLLHASSSWRCYVSGCAAALAVLTKPTFVAAGFTAAVHLLLTRRLRNLAYFTAGYCTVVLTTVGFLTLGGNGGYSFYFESVKTGYSVGVLIVNLRSLAASHTFFAAAVVVLAMLRLREQPSDATASLFSKYLLFSGLAGLLGAGRVGSNVNYFFEASAGLAILAGVGLGARLAIGRHQSFAPGLLDGTAILLSAALLTELFLTRPSSFKGRLIDALKKAPLHERAIHDLHHFVPPSEPVLTDYQGLVLAAGRTVYFNDRHMYEISRMKTMQSRLHSYLDARRLGALLTIAPLTIPGYVRIEGYDYQSPFSVSGVYSRGPVLYLRDDLWGGAAHGDAVSP